MLWTTGMRLPQWFLSTDDTQVQTLASSMSLLEPPERISQPSLPQKKRAPESREVEKKKKKKKKKEKKKRKKKGLEKA